MKLLLDLQFWMRWKKQTGSKPRLTGEVSNPQSDTVTIRDVRSRVGVISMKGGGNQRGPGEREGDTGVRHLGNQGSREVKHEHKGK